MKPVFISPTQIDMFLSCPRNWAWFYIAKVPKVDTAATAVGSRVHDILEQYAKDGTPPDVNKVWQFEDKGKFYRPGQIAMNMIGPGFPQPGTAEAEGKFNWNIEDGLIITGKIDLNWYDREGHTVFLMDHKTSSNPPKWGKKDEDLIKDTQATVYGAYLCKRYRFADSVKCIWNYGSTAGTKSHSYRATQTFTAAALTDKFYSEILPVVRHMRDLKLAKTDPLALPPNPEACELFRGCPHKERCNLSTTERLGALLMGSESMLADLIAKAKEDGQDVSKAEESIPTADGINPPESPVQTPDDLLAGVMADAAAGEEKTEPEPKPKPKKQTKKAATAPRSQNPAYDKEYDPTKTEVTIQLKDGAFEKIKNAKVNILPPDPATVSSDPLDKVVDVLVDRIMERLVERLSAK
jgi:hypothetical protein